MNVLIRADASLRIGTGHVMRCLTLANALRQCGMTVQFACRESLGHAIATIEKAGFAVIGMAAGAELAEIDTVSDGQADWDELDGMVSDLAQFDWLVVDHYALDAGFERAARDRVKRVAVIDDLANRSHEADVLVDCNLTATSDLYADLLPAQSTLLLGPRYALVRPAFCGDPMPIRADIGRVLVNFGGGDLYGVTAQVMDALEYSPDLACHFVAGVNNPHWTELARRVTGKAHWHLHRHVEDFAYLMRQSDLCIGAGGSSTWERAVVGLPTICIAIAQNQEANSFLMGQCEAFHYLGPAQQLTLESIRSAIESMRDPVRRTACAHRARQMVDGLGAKRIAHALLASS